MAANSTDLLKKLSRRWTAQVGSGGVSDASSATIPLSSTTNLATDTAVVATIDRVDANGTATPSLEETVIGVVSGSNLVTCTRGVEGTAQAHSAGAVVEILVTAKGYNDIIDHLLVQHNQDGTHKSALVTTLKAAGSDVTAGTSDLKIVTPKALKDSGVVLTKSVSIQVVAGATDTATGDGKFYFSVPAELNGMNLTGVFAAVVTAGTTNTTDIQIANVTDAVDMLITKLTVDSGETTSATAATPAVIDTSKDDVALNDIIRIDVDQVSSTPAKGLIIRLTFGF